MAGYFFRYVAPKFAKNLKERFDTKQKALKYIDKKGEGLAKESKVDVKSKCGIKKTVSKISKIIDDADKKGLDMTEKKAKGGRVGLRFGTKKKSNVEKIKKTFSPKSLGMQSVIYGLDKNKNVTAADPKAKFIAAANKKKKKKVI